MHNKIEFEYEFTNEFNRLTETEKSDVTKSMFIEGDFIIKINGIIFFNECIALLEFYFYLERWLENFSISNQIDFEYYSIEHEEDIALITVRITDDYAVLDVFQKVNELDNKFNLDYIIQEFELLRHRLKTDLEEFYQIKIDNYRDKLPLIYLKNEKQMKFFRKIRNFIYDISSKNN